VFAFVVLFSGTGCKEKPPVIIPQTKPKVLSNEIQGVWPPASTAKVTAYRFRTPNDVRNGTYSLLEGGKVDLGTLQECTEASAELTDEQTARLLHCTIGDHPRSGPSVCYEPHHLFLFRDGAGEITHAIEVCFTCQGVTTIPSLEVPDCHDLRGMERLCEETGVGLAEGTAD